MIDPRRIFSGQAFGWALTFALSRLVWPVADTTVQDFWKDKLQPVLASHALMWVAVIFDWLGPYWSGVASALVVMFAFELVLAWSRERQAKIRGQSSTPPAKQAQPDLSRLAYIDQVIDVPTVLSQIVEAKRYNALNGKTFVNCRFVGPASIMFNGNLSLAGSVTWNNMGEPLAIQAGSSVVGALPLIDVILNGCTFDDIQPWLTAGPQYAQFMEIHEKVTPPRKVPHAPVRSF